MRSFVSEYFDNRPLEELKITIANDMGEKAAKHHLSLFSIPVGAKDILEIGCGIGRLMKILAKDYYVQGIDASNDMVKYGREERLKIFKCAGDGSIPMQDSRFDYVFSLAVFQHIPDIEAVKRYIAEAYRVLRSGGILSFQCLAKEINKGSELAVVHDIEVLKKHIIKVGFQVPLVKNCGVWFIVEAKK